jgi:hypothetical protein
MRECCCLSKLNHLTNELSVACSGFGAAVLGAVQLTRGAR